jgi:hypothetical protein
MLRSYIVGFLEHQLRHFRCGSLEWLRIEHGMMRSSHQHHVIVMVHGC